MDCTQSTFEFEGATFGVRSWAGRDSAGLYDAERATDVCSWAGRDSEGSSASDGAAPLVLLHGFAQSARTWDAVAPLVAERGGRVFALDLAGAGESGMPACEEAFDLRFQARAVNAFCEHAADGAGARPVLAGYSMGGRVALAAACLAAAAMSGRAGGRAPFAALVLESAGTGPESDAAREALRERNLSWASRLRCEGVEPFMDFWETLPLFASQNRLSAPVRARLREERLSNSAEALALTFTRAGAHAMPSRDESLRALKALASCGVFVLYLAGELDAKYRAVLDGLARDGAGAIETRVIAGAGHNIHLEQPEAFASLLEEVCARIVG